jgi:hypothetical protein
VIEHDHEYCITDDGVMPGCPHFDDPAQNHPDEPHAARWDCGKECNNGTDPVLNDSKEG